ncbi:hypothetical protein SASPL_119933 [Salvia splendens]|uniref:Uncharacterized protein n=1 Tax=Salvia splendens TaxID=180675 RepID=A0A8X8XP81_SALSN|nr:hypothetical protein SASPL_119933 [Salvia splendens]
MSIHDFAVTEKYAVIPDMQIVVDPWLIVRGRSQVGWIGRRWRDWGLFRSRLRSKSRWLTVDPTTYDELVAAAAPS